MARLEPRSEHAKYVLTMFEEAENARTLPPTVHGWRNSMTIRRRSHRRKSSEGECQVCGKAEHTPAVFRTLHPRQAIAQAKTDLRDALIRLPNSIRDSFPGFTLTDRSYFPPFVCVFAGCPEHRKFYQGASKAQTIVEHYLAHMQEHIAWLLEDASWFWEEILGAGTKYTMAAKGLADVGEFFCTEPVHFAPRQHKTHQGLNIHRYIYHNNSWMLDHIRSSPTVLVAYDTNQDYSFKICRTFRFNIRVETGTLICIVLKSVGHWHWCRSCIEEELEDTDEFSYQEAICFALRKHRTPQGLILHRYI